VGKYVAKRVVLLLIIIFFVSIAAFFLVHLLPGNPTVTILGPNDTTANAAALNRQLGLDKPLIQQYWIWMSHVFQGNLGQSFTTHQTTTGHHLPGLPHRCRAHRHLADHRLRHSPSPWP
jgi:ABC-type dipeptide/oligopeptide/nickel transport system permease component